MTLLGAMEEWVVRQQPAHGVQIEYRKGLASVAKRSAVVGFKTPEALGSVAVWEGGDVEAEVLLIETLSRPLVVSAGAASASEIVHVFDRVLEAMSKV